jgi:hypothetical protein
MLCAVGQMDRSHAISCVFSQGEKSVALETVDIAVAWY